MQESLRHNCKCCKCNDCYRNDSMLGAIVKHKPEITYNNNRIYPTGKKAPHGIEIRFGTTRPTIEVREMLKAHGFKFSEKQTIWYAIDNPRSREMSAFLEANEIDADDTKYEKKHLWAKIKSIAFYKKLGNYTEFMLKTQPPRFFRTKKQLESSISNATSYIFTDMLRFKKFWNKVVGEDDDEGEAQEQDVEENDDEENEEEQEEEHEEQDEDEDQNPSQANLALAEKLMSLANGMEKIIDSKINSGTSKQNPTPKRLRVAAGMRQDGYNLRNIQAVLYALALAHKAGTIGDYSLLKHIKTRSQVELLNKYHDVNLVKHEDHYIKSVFKNNEDAFGQLGIHTDYTWGTAIEQKERLLSEFSNTSKNRRDPVKEKILELEMKIKGIKIPGFFPTPKSLIERLLEFASIKKQHSILEPSAGKGDILDAIREQFGNENLNACEISSILREVLILKGYSVLSNDFLELKEKFDRIIMNPPFENGQDIDHVTHALNILNPGGRVVAIMGEGFYFRLAKKDSAFRELLMEKNAYVSEPIKNAFKNSFNSTGVNVRIVVINEDGTNPEILDEEESEDEEAEDMDLLEIEAQAEIELLKLQVELARKRKGLNGLSETNNDKLNYLRLLAKDLPILPAVWDFK